MSSVNDALYSEEVERLGDHNVGQVLGSAGSRTSFLLSVLGQESLRQAREVLSEHNLKPRQLRILDLLAAGGPIGQRELGELMAIDHSALVNMLNPLEADGLIKRQRDTTDRRRHLVTITAAGKRRLSQADQAFRDAEDTFLAPLSSDQRALLHAALIALRDASRPPDDCQ